MIRTHGTIPCIVCTIGIVCGIALAICGPAAAGPEGETLFEARVRPVLVERCTGCHGAEKQRGGLRLDSRDAILQGGNAGPALVPGDPGASPIVAAVRREGELKMPPDGKLPGEAIDAIAEWIRAGAPWPSTTTPRPAADASADSATVSEHWAFRPIADPPPPPVRNEGWPRSDIDRFILAKLEERGLAPRPQADRRTLIRRAAVDLTGLPPTMDEVDAFVRDEAPDAFEKVVDRLLASPRHGERWGRHWLDIARYADTKGYVFQEERRYPYAYTYRDWVIRALNEDLPYDRFLLEQIAADLLPAGEDNRALAAMGFLTLGRRFLNNVHDIIDDRIDVVTRGTMALTVSCARCHDHKYDPIPAADYYSLYGVFASSVEPGDLPLLGKPERTREYLAFEAELKARESAVASFLETKRAEMEATIAPDAVERLLDRAGRDALQELRRKVDEWKVSSPAAPPRAMSLAESPTPHDPAVFLRGNPGNRGKAVPRQFLSAIEPDRKPFREGSGRLEMAHAIASPSNPLTARVIVNRVWLHHFGAGLVRTPADFGARSDPPTHPELLDHLATTFIRDGWSLKRLHRRILLSSVWRQASDDDPSARETDPENRLLWKQSLRRLDFEALRDSLLAASGRLDLTEGGPSVDITTQPFSTRRTVYGFIDRQNLPGLFRTFDFASPDATNAQRHATTVPQQALYLMNSPFVVEAARHLAARPEVASRTEPAEQVRALYRIALVREPGDEEIALALRYLGGPRTDGAQAEGPARIETYAQALLLSNEFSFVD